MGILSKLSRMLKSKAHSEIFGNYRTVGEPLAQGPMSVVYKASGLGSDPAVAIKVLKDSAARVARRLSALCKTATHTIAMRRAHLRPRWR